MWQTSDHLSIGTFSGCPGSLGATLEDNWSPQCATRKDNINIRDRGLFSPLLTSFRGSRGQRGMFLNHFLMKHPPWPSCLYPEALSHWFLTTPLPPPHPFFFFAPPFLISYFSLWHQHMLGISSQFQSFISSVSYLLLPFHVFTLTYFLDPRCTFLSLTLGPPPRSWRQVGP